MQKPRGNDSIAGLRFTEDMVNFYAESAKAYWRMWGPLGEPMIQGVDAWVDMQRGYFQWLRSVSGAEGQSFVASPQRDANEVVERSFKEAERIAKESAREAKRTAREAERSAEEAQESSEEDIRNIISESVRRSETERREEAQAGTTVSEENGADVEEELPVEDYDSLDVHQVTKRLGDLSVEEIEQLRNYEANNRSRRSLMQRFESRIRAGRKGLRSTGETEENSGEDIRSIVRESVRRSEGEG